MNDQEIIENLDFLIEMDVIAQNQDMEIIQSLDEVNKINDEDFL